MAVECLAFGTVIILVTAVWVYALRGREFETLALAMFFPGAAALLTSLATGQLGGFLRRISGVDDPVRSVVFSVVAVVAVLTIVETCVAVSRFLGWATPSKGKETSIHRHNRNYLPGFLRAAGEEVGWRCFLLPCLLESYTPGTALLISGLFWGMFHVPVMLLLVSLKRPPRPVITVLVQCLSCVLSAFPHGWLAIKSSHSLWAASIMHWFWNVYNPITLGSIYTNTPGKYTGQQWKINGEGLMGCIAMAPLAVLASWELNNSLL